ncbi:MAG: enoyl-CoA hydratase/isomerase family protein [Candidatus Obscuribacterales bacterium]|nr:enoyl-CoA hydratase/isomerase family protein [Candidatus Obscuribacterales bacterium]
MSTLTYKNIKCETEGPLAIVTLNRPQALNALSTELMSELAVALEGYDADEKVRVIILTGSERAFAAGADIKEMCDEDAISIAAKDNLAVWDKVKFIKKPIIAAVSGFALGGGCELAMTCDMIIASETAQFGQPEINIGVMPGAGGTQRLTAAVGKYKAMELILSGRPFTAAEALSMGLVNKVVPAELLLDEAKALAKEIAKKSPLALRAAKEAILKSLELSMNEGLTFERKAFYSLFASQDQKEGMKAFMEKRQATFTGR